MNTIYFHTLCHFTLLVSSLTESALQLNHCQPVLRFSFMLLRNYYVTEVSKISYGNNKLSLNGLDNGHVIFDSGSSYTYFTKQAYADLVTTVSSYVLMSLDGSVLSRLGLLIPTFDLF